MTRGQGLPFPPTAFVVVAIRPLVKLCMMAQLVSPRVRTVVALEVHTDRVSEGERQAWLPDPGSCLFSLSFSVFLCHYEVCGRRFQHCSNLFSGRLRTDGSRLHSASRSFFTWHWVACVTWRDVT